MQAVTIYTPSLKSPTLYKLAGAIVLPSVSIIITVSKAVLIAVVRLTKSYPTLSSSIEALRFVLAVARPGSLSAIPLSAASVAVPSTVVLLVLATVVAAAVLLVLGPGLVYMLVVALSILYIVYLGCRFSVLELFAYNLLFSIDFCNELPKHYSFL